MKSNQPRTVYKVLKTTKSYLAVNGEIKKGWASALCECLSYTPGALLEFPVYAPCFVFDQAAQAFEWLDTTQRQRRLMMWEHYEVWRADVPSGVAEKPMGPTLNRRSDIVEFTRLAFEDLAHEKSMARALNAAVMQFAKAKGINCDSENLRQLSPQGTLLVRDIVLKEMVPYPHPMCVA